MRNLTNTPSVVPASDTTVHLVLDDFGKLGLSYRETDIAAADERSVIDAMIDGQYEAPLQIVAFNVAEGWARDVSGRTPSLMLRANANPRIYRAAHATRRPSGPDRSALNERR